MDKLASKNYENRSSSPVGLEYELITTHIDDSDHLMYTTYGIVARENGGTVAEYPDVSTSREYVERFINMLETHDVAAVHIGDLLEDYLD